MSEKMSHRFEATSSADYSRRELLKRAGRLLLGAAVLTPAIAPELRDPVIEAARKARDAGGEAYSNDPFIENAGATKIDRKRLDELLVHDSDEVLNTTRTDKGEQENPDTFAEFTFTTDDYGPVYADFEGLGGDGVSLTILKASVDDGAEFFVPLIRTPGERQSIPIQLGEHEPGPHRLDVALHHSSVPIDPYEIIPHLTQGRTGTISSYINSHQPDIYPRYYGNINNNTPYRSLAFVYEAEEDLALVYWNECLDGDLEYGLFGTKLGQLIETKERPTDFDWVAEVVIDKHTGSLKSANYGARYHRRGKLSVHPEAKHIPLQIDSANNNVAPVSDERLLSLPKFRPRPQILVHEERWSSHALYGTSDAAARYNMCENHAERTLILPRDQWILDKVGADIDDCQN